MLHQSINKGLVMVCLCSVFVLTFVASAHREEFRVTEASLAAEEARMSGPCPLKVVFNGVITANGPGTVKYTFTRSDGARGAAYAIEFKTAGKQAVSTDWTLGDAKALPHFEGWQAIQILSPNNLESNHAPFTVDCAQANVKPMPGASQGKNTAETYAREWPNLPAPYRIKLEQELAKLKSFADKMQPAMAGAQQKLGFDDSSMRAEFRAMIEERDTAKRAQMSAEFKSKHEPEIMKLAQTAGLDPAVQRQQLSTLLDLSNIRVKDTGRMVFDIDPNPTATPTEAPTPSPTHAPTPAPTPTDVEVVVLTAPFTDSGVSIMGGGGVDPMTRTSADRTTGELDLNNHVFVAGSQQKVAFIQQDLPVTRGVRRVHVAATFDPLSHHFFISPLGYSSVAALVNLRVLDGTQVVCSSLGYSLGRIITFGSYVDTGGSTSLTMTCEFTRPEPDDAITYTMVAEIEGWAGVGGLPSDVADVEMHGTVTNFRVMMHRR